MGTIERWAKAEGVDLENEAQRATAKLRNAGRVLPGPRPPEKPGVIEHQPLGVDR